MAPTTFILIFSLFNQGQFQYDFQVGVYDNIFSCQKVGDEMQKKLLKEQIKNKEMKYIKNDFQCISIFKNNNDII